MGLFTRKKADIPAIADPVAHLYSMCELNALSQRVGENEVIKNFVDGAHLYNAYENADTYGNFFGSEFDIRATAGRIKSTYAREPWVWTSATLIARMLSTVPLLVKNAQTEEVDDTHPLNSKLEAANNLQSSLEMQWCGYLDLVLGGNFILAFDQTFNEALHLPIELISLKISQDRKAIEEVQLWDANVGRYANSINYKQCVHLKYPNPFNPYYGLSMLTAASRPILMDRFKNEFEMAFYLRGATNSGVIETTEDINKTRMERLMRTFEQVYTGKRNWWRTIFLPKGAKWISSGLTMSEMQHLEGLRENRLSLLGVLGIPPSQVGIVQDVNRSTSETQEKTLWNNTLVPLAEFIAAGWNNSYLVKTIYGGKVYVEADFSDVEALQGSLETKGAQAKSMENYFLVDEIREQVFGEEPLPEGKGQRFVAEIKPAQANPIDTLGLSAPTTDGASTETPVEAIVDETSRQIEFSGLKDQATQSQERIERKITQEYLKGYEGYFEMLIGVARQALKMGRDVQGALVSVSNKLEEKYVKGVEKPLVSALERGFSYAASQSKACSRTHVRHKHVVTKRLRFSETDQQAIDALRAEQADGKRTILVQRAIDHFVGFNETRTKEVLDVIATNAEAGMTLDKIAEDLRSLYDEAYKNQAFTVARTEVLSAVSEGIKWNHDVLGEVFSKVQKQWYHVGDVGSNPNARENHYQFELQGPQDADHKWGGVLEYPRDPSAGADETINCRCTMVSVIPDDAVSNADVILENV